MKYLSRHKIYSKVEPFKNAKKIYIFCEGERKETKNEEVAVYDSFKEFVAVRIKGGFDNRSMPLEIQQAASNAEENFESENGQPKIYSTEVFSLAKQIINFTKTQLDQCLADLKDKTKK